MPYIYSVEGAPATPYATHATPNTEDPTVVLRQATRGFDLQAIYVHGRGVQLVSLTGIGYRVQRWTTVGSGGGTVVPRGRRLPAPTASTGAVDKTGAIVAGTVTGGYQVAFGCGAAGPGGWVAMNSDSCIHVENGSADELSINSVCGLASVLHHVSAEIVE